MVNKINNSKEEPIKKNWFKKHPILRVFLAVFLFLFAIGIILPFNDKQPTPTQYKAQVEQINSQQNIASNVQSAEEQVQECLPNWNCDSWSDCKDGSQTRKCTDINNCNKIDNKPAENQSCKVKEKSLSEKINECTELCAGDSIDIPYIKNTCRSDCYQIYYYAGEAELDKYIEELKE